MWWVLLLLLALLLLFSTFDVWYFLRAAVVILRARFQPPVRDVTAEQTLTGRVTTRDIDMCHMNNARYLRECDFARFSLYMRNGVFKALRALKASMVVGATTIRYRRALCIGEGYDLRSRIVTWDEKAFFLEQRFVSAKDGLVCAVMYCKQSVIGSSPDQIMQHLCKRKVRSRTFSMHPRFCRCLITDGLLRCGFFLAGGVSRVPRGPSALGQLHLCQQPGPPNRERPT